MATAAASTTLYVNVKRGRRRSDHFFTLNTHIEGSKELSDRLAAIGSDNQFGCSLGATTDGKSTVEIVILSGNHQGIYTSRLHDIVATLASQTHTPDSDVLIDVEKAVTVTLAELHAALGFAPGKAYEVDITVRELGDNHTP